MDYKQIKSSRYYKLRYEYKQYKKEYNELEFIFNKISIKFTEAVQEFCLSHNLSDPFTNNAVRPQNVGGFGSLETKSLYRSLALKTHPDKKTEIKEKERIFNEATKAKSSNNLQELINLSKEIQCAPQVDEITFDQLDLLEFNLNEIKEKINSIKTSAVWLWFYSNSTKREEVLLKFVEF